MTYLCLAGIEIAAGNDSEKLGTGRVSNLIVWFLVQLASSLALQIVINAVGSLYTDVEVLRSERGSITDSQAKNVFVLNSKNKSVLSAKVKSKWLADNVNLRHDKAGDPKFDFQQKVFKVIDDKVFSQNVADPMKIAGDLG